MSERMDRLDAFLAAAWHCLGQGVADRRAAARHPTLATIAGEGGPALRTVVLRAVDEARATLDIHTDLLSAKVAEIAADPRVALHVWDDATRLQIRLSGEALILTGAQVDGLWDNVPAESRLGYGSDPRPGAPIAAAGAYRRSADRDRFAVLRIVVSRIDLLHLGPVHARARFGRADQWAGEWLSP